jgi:type I restriction enzyme S subunit
MSICATVGRPIETQIDTCIHDGFVLFDEPLVDQSFLYHLLIALEPTWSKQGQTGSQMNLNTGIINSCAVPVPPLPEQKAIAQALSDMDALLSGLDDLIAKKRDIKQATMQQLLTGKTRLPGFTGEWEIKRLGDVAILRSGYSFRSEDYSLLGNFKIVTIANVQSGYMTLEGCQSVFGLPTDLQSHQRLNVGDILISMTGNVGRVCRVTEPDCLLNQRVGKISHVGIDEDFLFTLLGQQSFLEEMTKKAKGGAQPNLSNADITEYRIRIPNDCSEQKAIATILSDMDAELEALEQRREKTRELKQAMMQELLTGRTRLV